MTVHEYLLRVEIILELAAAYLLDVGSVLLLPALVVSVFGLLIYLGYRASHDGDKDWP